MPKKLLLLVDRDPHVQALVRDLVAPHDWSVEVAEEADGALALLNGRTPDAVMTEVLLPGCDGLALVRRLHEQVPTLPVIVCSMVRASERAERAGARTFVAKPIAPEVLLGALQDADPARRAS